MEGHDILADSSQTESSGPKLTDDSDVISSEEKSMQKIKSEPHGNESVLNSNTDQCIDSHCTSAQVFDSGSNNFAEALDSQGNSAHVYEGNTVQDLDSESNPMHAVVSECNTIHGMDSEGETLHALDSDDHALNAIDPEGDTMHAMDAEDNALGAVDAEGSSVHGVEGNSIEGMQTMTISLEDAAHIILQQQGLGEGNVHLSPGTYHILTQHAAVGTDGDRNTGSGLGATNIRIIQTAAGLQAFGNQPARIFLQANNTSEASVIFHHVPTAAITEAQGEITPVSQLNDIELTAHKTHIGEDGITEDQHEGQDKEEQSVNNSADDSSSEAADLLQEKKYEKGRSAKELPSSEDKTKQEEESASEQKNDASRKPDLSKPIQVDDQTEVIINGKKCILKVDPDTGQLCAYPLLPPAGKRRRGRPRRQDRNFDELGEGERNEKPMTMTFASSSNDQVDQSQDQTNSAAECLLELSNTGPDGLRRSGRMRKKASTLEDYEVLEISSGEDDQADDEDAEVTLSISKKRKVASSPKEIQTFSPFMIGIPMKRGRGRPRRYPPPGQTTVNQQIPAMIIPGINGQTIMMAPLQGLSNLHAFQEQVKSMPLLLPKVEPTVTTADDGSQYLNKIITSSSLTNGIAGTDSLPTDSGNSTSALSSELTRAAEAAEAGVLVVSSMSNLSPEMSPGTSLSNDENTTDSASGEESRKDVGVQSAKVTVTSGENQPTIIQIPENLLPMFMQKKDPIKIGLKSTESDLEKLKCPKCNFQGFYQQQYQSHIITHSEDICRCKCCNYVTLDKEELLEHFKDNHPRCICTICDFMAEHAYVIKRHMMRHNTSGATTCDICGKMYKDQYILKMHIKMVHLPAEVLFECTTCSKKFTRKAHLKRHLRIHDPEKPFKCPHCDYRGCEKSDISKHLLIHEEPKHLCEVCGKTFRHIKNKELHVKRHNGQRDYKCGVCDFYGYTFTDIRKHIERKHTDMKSLFCEKCGVAFKSEAQLRDHRAHQCDVFMIEQALAIATSDGSTSQATIQIPSSITIDGQQIALDSDGQVNITVEQVNIPEDENITLTEEQLQEVVGQGQVMDTGQVELTVSEIPVQQVELDQEEVDLASEEEGITISMSE
ncbi:hypothetical protein CHS0354_002341 [Potamilus streckersoni]|uniref:C2H2-type domain-containing protein n=1 Tax=Potamilus streckersoni TaxID=2493646 RepID=A0AAE0SN89_9BIVA|nr:hypothetical protein CHS0354_002341 [Potamilus streckersoni]